jgi:ABC-2 type transport system ATP-binding protein
MSVMIKADNLGRYFGPIKAVDGVSFEVSRGEVLGFLGPNGAGKSTTMKMLACFLTPSFGRASVGGFDVLESPREVRQLLGYLPENAPLYGEMEVLDFLTFVAEVRGLAKSEQRLAVQKIIEKTSISEVLYQRVETLSKGYKRRVGLAQALIHDPQVLILDEPTDGLDPNQKHEVRELIREMAADKSIILSTHILEEVDAVCTRAIIIAGGKVVADETPESLRRRSRHFGAVSLAFRVQPENLEEQIRSIDGVRDVEWRHIGGCSRLLVMPREGTLIFPRLVEAAEHRSWQLTDISAETGQLDEVFRALTQNLS